MEHLNRALKEWAIAVDALEQGDMILLLRKGGIREQGGTFSVDHQRVLLYPTYEHQNPHLLKPPYDTKVHPVESGWHPGEIYIGSFADITDIFQVTETTVVQALSPYHIWNAQFVEERLNWKPKTPLYVLALRVFKLAESCSIPYQKRYGGCRSWLDLNDEIGSVEGCRRAIATAIPVLATSAYQERLRQIKTVLAKD
ncbi:DUF1802 family protein [Myxacorys almedinensis]|uniref:DUF1802 family protein n=1 Tax=Myxacorys almedinensis A TaxID=2690445 RepID=A0A8J7Z2G8_9CYAN|nr:DUF1802 family protein [Myxacorys almedinensis]NDJ18809.1 DUF1802 family protein [Myxacorys almedinensis A]